MELGKSQVEMVKERRGERGEGDRQGEKEREKRERREGGRALGAFLAGISPQNNSRYLNHFLPLLPRAQILKSRSSVIRSL